MEYIFEDFIAGFLETHFSDVWKVEYQKSDLYLSDKPTAFNLQHDIFLTRRNDFGKTLIVDAKYKIREKNFADDTKKGISQSDMYQMLSYAYKRGCPEVVLLYPNTTAGLNEPNFFEINSGFDQNLQVKIKAMEVPFWSMDGALAVDERLKDVLKHIESQASGA
jgi:5-methylcytosine-specific restriction enzyme subunit McrC